MQIIEVAGLKKRYGQVEALKGIDFSVENGSLFALLGPNGAGKSTTISILCALCRADEGSVRIDGYDPHRETQEVLKRIGVVFQDSLLDTKLTVEENLLLRASLYGMNREEQKSAVLRSAQTTGLTELMKRPYGRLSGGQRRRADIARALLGTPRILFLDEPTTGLDPQTRRKVWETIRQLQQDGGMTVVLTTHYLEEAEAADRVVIVDEGRIAADGSIALLKERYGSAVCTMTFGSEEEARRFASSSDGQGGNRQMEHYGNRILMRRQSTRDFLPWLRQAGEQITDFEVREGTLEDVFLTVTGKEIRE